LLCGLEKETAGANALLSRVLRRGSASLPDMESITAALDDLYGVRIEPIIRKKGEIQCIGFYVDFPDDRYIPGGESIAESAVKILADILLSPCLQEGLLREDYIESEKSNLIDDIRAGINDKRGYSVDRLLEEMCAGEAFGVSKLGDEERVREITCKSLTEHYYNIIANSRIEILYCGSISPQRVDAMIRHAFSGLSDRTEPNIPKTDVVYDPHLNEPRRFSETLDVTQCKLVAGFRIGDAMKTPDYPAFMMFNALYGGSVSSKLFLNVRERLSLCYYASSMLDKHKGIMLVTSGVEFSNAEIALNEILAQLENIKSADITELEFTSAKRSIMTSIRSALDRSGGLEELYFDSVLSAVTYNPAELCSMIDDVTVERVIKASSGIKLDSVYLLSGTEDIEITESKETDDDAK